VRRIDGALVRGPRRNEASSGIAPIGMKTAATMLPPVLASGPGLPWTTAMIPTIAVPRNSADQARIPNDTRGPW
jgi:hypothetical protein